MCFRIPAQEYWPAKMCRIINSKYLIDFNVYSPFFPLYIQFIQFRSTDQMIRFASWLNHYQHAYFFTTTSAAAAAVDALI